MPCGDGGRGEAATVQGTPGAAGRAGGRGGKEGAFPDPLRVDPRQRFALRPAASRTAIEDIPVVLSHLVFGTLSWQP